MFMSIREKPFFVRLAGWIAIALAVLLGLSSCRRAGDETRIRRLVTELAAAAEKGDGERFESSLAVTYHDNEGRDRAGTRALLQEYQTRYGGIVVHLLDVRIETDRPPDAWIEVDAALSSGAADTLRRLVRFSGECYRFRCRLVRDGVEWKVAAAEWRLIGSENLSGAAIKTLKEIFPLP